MSSIARTRTALFNQRNALGDSESSILMTNSSRRWRAAVAEAISSSLCLENAVESPATYVPARSCSDGGNALERQPSCEAPWEIPCRNNCPSMPILLPKPARLQWSLGNVCEQGSRPYRTPYCGTPCGTCGGGAGGAASLRYPRGQVVLITGGSRGRLVSAQAGSLCLVAELARACRLSGTDLSLRRFEAGSS